MGQQRSSPDSPEPEVVKWVHWIVAHFAYEGKVLRQAPVAFITGVAVVGALIYVGLQWHNAGVDATKDATIENQRAHIATLEEQVKGLSPQQAAINAKRKAIVAQLQKFYVESTPILNANLTKDITNDDFAKYVASFNEWVNRTATWIQSNMGDAARDRFLDYGAGFSFNWDRAANPVHNNIINVLSAYRKNLSTLIETNAWDRINQASSN